MQELEEGFRKMNKTMPRPSSDPIDDAHRAKLRAMYIAGFKQQQKEQLHASQAAFKQRYLQQQQETNRRSGMPEVSVSNDSSGVLSFGSLVKSSSTLPNDVQESLSAPKTTTRMPQAVEPMISQPALHPTAVNGPTPPPLPVSLSITTLSSTGMHQKTGTLGVTSIDRITGGVSFPRKLMEILSKEDPTIVTWLPSGRSFRVLNNKEFAKTVLIKYFRHDRITSFQRQLNLYGFRRVQKGPEGGAYQHDLFRRDQPHLCLQMKRANQKPSPTLSSQTPPQVAALALSDPSAAFALSDPLAERRDDPPAVSGSGSGAAQDPTDNHVGRSTSNVQHKEAALPDRSVSISKNTVNLETSETIQVSRMPSKIRLSSNGLGMLMSSSVGTFTAMDIDMNHEDECEGNCGKTSKDDRDSQASALAAAGMLAEHYNRSSLKAMPPVFDSSGSLKKFGEVTNKFQEKRGFCLAQSSSESDDGCDPHASTNCDTDGAMTKKDSDDFKFLKPRHPDEGTPTSLSPWAADREGVDNSSDFDFLNVFASENDLQSLTIKP